MQFLPCSLQSLLPVSLTPFAEMNRLRNHRPSGRARGKTAALLSLLAALALSGGARFALAQTTFSSSSLGCTLNSGGSGASSLAGGGLQINGPNAHGQCTMQVSGGSGTVQTITVKLNGVDSQANESVCYSAFTLKGPNNQTFELLGATGNCQETMSGLVINIADSNSSSAPLGANPWANTGATSVKPSSYWTDPSSAGEGSVDPIVAGDDIPQTDGTATLNGTFGSGASAANGSWTLGIATDDPTGNTGIISVSNWSITVTSSAAVATTTSLSSQNPILTIGGSTTSSILTATVTSSGNPVASGTATFTANGATIGGCGGVAVNSSGQAHCTASASVLGQGIKSLQANYTGNGSFGSSSSNIVSELVELTPTRTADTWCNSGSITIPTAQGIGAIYPSAIHVSGYLAGRTVSNVQVQLLGETGTVFGQHLLVAPDRTHNLDFLDGAWSQNSTSSFNLTFLDSATAYPHYTDGSNVPSTGNYLASDDLPNGTNPDTFPTALAPTIDTSIPQVPATINYGYNPFFPAEKGLVGNIFESEIGGAPANGDWALYAYEFDAFNETIGGGWCINLTLNPVTVTPTLGHNGSGASGGFVDGEQNAAITVGIENNGTGSAGDPSGSNTSPLQVVDTLPTGLTYVSGTGTDWSCTASGQVVTCKNDDTVAQGSSYSALTIDVNVASNASSSLANSITVSGADVTSTSANDTIPVTASPSLAIALSHAGNFTQGQNGQWDIVVSNTATNSTTSGAVTVTDTLPTGYVLVTSSGAGWSCSGTGTATCTSSQGVSGGSSFATLVLTVSVPTNSPASVSDTASVYGGGDPVHNTLGTAVTSNTDTVSVIATSTTTAANATATFSASSQQVTLSATVTSTAGTVDSGTITFTVLNGGTPIGASTSPVSVSNGSASATYTLPGGTNAGTYTITASYAGAGSFTSSSDNTHTLTVSAAPTTTTAASQTATASGSSQSVLLSATVTSTAGTVNAGTVTFTVLNGGTQVGSAATSSTLSNGNASVNYTLPAGTASGTYTIQAVYSGSTNFTGSSDNTHTLTINGGSTVTTTSNASATFSTNNQSVTLSATVTSTAGTVNSGTITFTVLNGGTPIGASTSPVSVSNGSASASYTLPGGTNAGTYTITASYIGTGSFTGSSDNTHTLTVSAATTTTAAANQSAAFSGSNQSVTLSATVTSTGGTVNAGTVTFTVLNGGTPVGTATTSGTVSNGIASVGYTLPGSTPNGTYTIQAVYNGSTNFTGSSDNAHTLTINGGSTVTTTSNATATFSASSQQVTLSATVTSTAGTVNSGTITFTVLNGGTPIGASTSPASVSNGTASAAYTLPGGTNAGTYTIVASYAGASGFTASSDNTHTLTVIPASQTIAFGAIAQQVPGTPLTLTATASSGLPVSYTSTTIPVCTVSNSTATFLQPGICSITASQAGNSNYNAAAPVTQSFSVVLAPAVTLITTSSMSGSHSAGYTATVTIRNTGTSPALNVVLSAATLGTTSGTPLPQTWGTIAPGGTATLTVDFPGSAGLDGAGAAEKLSGTYTGGSFAGNIRSVTLP
ncbi:MAG: Ig-like domain repeat protein [Terracidiphilus sp.]